MTFINEFPWVLYDLFSESKLKRKDHATGTNKDI